MRLICPECGRRTATNQYARQFDTCGAPIIVQDAAIVRTKRGIRWIPQRTAPCTGVLRRFYVGIMRAKQVQA